MSSSTDSFYDYYIELMELCRRIKDQIYVTRDIPLLDYSTRFNDLMFRMADLRWR